MNQMSALKPVVEGWQEPIRNRLLNDGLPVGIQGRTVELVLKQSDGTEVDTIGKAANLDDGTEPLKGVVQYTPGADDLKAAHSPYTLHWKVTAGGEPAFWPNGKAAELKVYDA